MYLDLSSSAIFIGLTSGSFHVDVGVPLGFGVLLGFCMLAPEGSEAAAHQAYPWRGGGPDRAVLPYFELIRPGCRITIADLACAVSGADTCHAWVCPTTTIFLSPFFHSLWRLISMLIISCSLSLCLSVCFL